MNTLPTRKNNRLTCYDYSENGAYFITICTKDKKCILSRIVGATIGRPAVRCFVFASGFGKFVTLYRAGDQWSPLQ